MHWPSFFVGWTAAIVFSVGISLLLYYLRFKD